MTTERSRQKNDSDQHCYRKSTRPLKATQSLDITNNQPAFVPHYQENHFTKKSFTADREQKSANVTRTDTLISHKKRSVCLSVSPPTSINENVYISAAQHTNHEHYEHSRSNTHSGVSEKIKRKPVFLKKSASLKNLFFSKTNDNPEKKSQSRTSSKFAETIRKKLLPANLSTSFRPKSSLNIPAISCPTLTVTEEKSSDGPEPEVNKDTDKQNKVQFLSIPDINEQIKASKTFSKTDFLFTTSFTHSTSSVSSAHEDDVKLQQTQKALRHKCKSAQNLHKSSLSVLKQPLIRSFSDVPTGSLSAARSQNNLSGYLQSNMFRNKYVSQLLDYMFIGSVEAAYNEPLLCKLKIDCLLDISNVQASLVPVSRKLHCPCMCPMENQHFRSRLIIQVDDDEKEDIESYFQEINKFIHGAKKLNKRVLVFSDQGQSRAPTVAIQYLMTHENFLLRQAFNLVKNQRPNVDINPGFMAKLETAEHVLFPEAKPSLSFGNEYLNIADPQAIKCAWIDCTDS